MVFLQDDLTQTHRVRLCNQRKISRYEVLQLIRNFHGFGPVTEFNKNLSTNIILGVRGDYITIVHRVASMKS